MLALSLMAFVLLLMVAFVSLTRVQTEVSSQQLQATLARQNALLAVQLAVGELQKFAGPDQRVSGTADLVAQTDQSGVASPSSVAVSVQNGTRFWTGIWGNRQALPANRVDRYALKPNEIVNGGTAPAFLNWLVSGNEAVSFTVRDRDGSIANFQNVPFGPEGTVSVSASATALSNDLSIMNRDGIAVPAALLVGPNSVGASAVSDFVLAPLISIEESGSGRYAWWVGDEGVKARANLRNGYLKSGEVDDQISSFITSQQSSVSSLDRDRSGNLIGLDFDSESVATEQLVTLDQFPLNASSDAARDRLDVAQRARFHDMTLSSRGVLADSYNGGLRKDLTADIVDTSSDFSYRPANDEAIFEPLNPSEANLPTWGHLRSWARTQADNTGVLPVVPSDTVAGVAPILSYASLGLSTWIDTFDSNRIYVNIYPIAVFTNPYTVPIRASDYDLSFQWKAGSCLYYRTAPAGTAADAKPDGGQFATEATLDMGTFKLHSGEKTPTELAAQSPSSIPVSFRIRGSVIPPGETHVYVLDSSEDGQNYQAGRLMTRAPDDSIVGLTNRLELAATIPVEISTVAAPDTRKLVVWSRNVSKGGGAWPNDTLKVELTTAGGVGNPNAVYQRAEMIMSDRQIAYLGYRVFQTASTNLPITDWEIDPGMAMAAFRMGSVLEARGIFADMGGSMGMAPFLHKPWLRLANLRAPFAMPTYAEVANTAEGGPITLNGQNAYFQRAGSIARGALLANPIGASNTALMSGNNRYSSNLAGWFESSSPPRYTTFFDLLDSPDRLLSLGQLQHVPFSRYSFYPSYPLGNSVADVRIDRTTTYRLGLSSGMGPGTGSGIVLRPNTATTFDPAYDLSWHLNRAMWDRYFVSGVPLAWSQSDLDQGKNLPNARMNYRAIHENGPSLNTFKASPGNSDAYDQAAANLVVEGAFNINSTSEQAWRAVLAGKLDLPSNPSYAHQTDNVDGLIPYPRFWGNQERVGNGPFEGLSQTMSTDFSSQDGFLDTYYQGNRGLFLGDAAASSSNASAEAVVNELARTIVREIRRRGPFLSLADFINRPIYDTREDAGIKGALQAAIDRTEAPGQVNPVVPIYNYARRIFNTGNNQNPYPSWDDEHYQGGPDSERGVGRDAFSLISAFAPKYLTQADLLSSLGPFLSARSDTFRIRTYGESRNATTNKVEGRAWCEAIVQRVPEYIDPAINPNAWDEPNGINRIFGRRYKILFVRWLSPSEI